MNTTQDYAWNAHDYHENSPNQARWAREIISRLQLDGSERILDVGCGDGKLSAELAGLVPRGRVLGVDVSEAMVRFARERFEGSVPNLAFRREDAGALPSLGQFDVVVSFTCLHWIRDHPPVLRGIRDNLKPGGRTFLQFGGRGVGGVIHGLVDDIVARDAWRERFRDFTFPWFFYDAEEYRPWLENAGLRPLRVELVPHEGVFTRDGLAGWIRSSWIPYMERLPEERRDDFLGAVVGEAFEHASGDVLRLTLHRLEVEAERPD